MRKDSRIVFGSSCGRKGLASNDDQTSVCYFWRKGICKFGSKCHNLHPVDKHGEDSDAVETLHKSTEKYDAYTTTSDSTIDDSKYHYDVSIYVAGLPLLTSPRQLYDIAKRHDIGVVTRVRILTPSHSNMRRVAGFIHMQSIEAAKLLVTMIEVTEVDGMLLRANIQHVLKTPKSKTDSVIDSIQLTNRKEQSSGSRPGLHSEQQFESDKKGKTNYWFQDAKEANLHGKKQPQTDTTSLSQTEESCFVCDSYSYGDKANLLPPMTSQPTDDKSVARLSETSVDCKSNDVATASTMISNSKMTSYQAVPLCFKMISESAFNDAQSVTSQVFPQVDGNWTVAQEADELFAVENGESNTNKAYALTIKAPAKFQDGPFDHGDQTQTNARRAYKLHCLLYKNLHAELKSHLYTELRAQLLDDLSRELEQKSLTIVSELQKKLAQSYNTHRNMSTASVSNPGSPLYSSTTAMFENQCQDEHLTNTNSEDAKTRQTNDALEEDKFKQFALYLQKTIADFLTAN